jgi:hypothetical protein
MKKSLLIIGALLVGTSFFSSCNNKLKDDIDAMEKEIADLKNKQEETKAILGANEPITATTTFVDDDGVTRTITQTFKFKANDDYTQYLGENENGTYTVYIERFGDVNWNEGAWVSFVYDPQTGDITEKRAGHYWDEESEYYDNAWYAQDYYSVDANINITLHSFNISTGDISLSVNARGNEDYTSQDSWISPNQGSIMTTKFSFNGKLKLFPYEAGSMEELKKVSKAKL